MTDILFEYLPPDSGITPEVAVARVRAVVDGPAGVAAYLKDALSRDHAADGVVVQLAEALERPSPHTKETVSRLLEVVESPLAMELYDNEMQRRQPRDADRWH